MIIPVILMHMVVVEINLGFTFKGFDWKQEHLSTASSLS